MSRLGLPRQFGWIAWLWLWILAMPGRAEHPSAPQLYIVTPESHSTFATPRSSPTDILVIVYLSETDHDVVQGVDVWADGKRLGAAERSAGTPSNFDVIYRFLWREVRPGEHTLQARGVGENVLNPVVSKVVPIVVTPPPTNQPPEVRLALQERAVWFTPGLIPLTALAHDLDGYVATVEFFADATSLGVVTNGCPFCENFPHVFNLTWTNPPIGLPAITAVATDDQGATTRSASTILTVKSEGLLNTPVVTVQTDDPEALEADRDPVTFRFEPEWLGAFRLTRTGSLEADTVVFFNFEGSATRETDYQLHPQGFGPCELPCRRADIFIEGNSVVIPAGQASTQILVRGLPDGRTEGRESVILKLVDDPTLGPIPRYLVGLPSTAEVGVVDPLHPTARATLIEPKSGTVFAAGASIQLTAVAEDPPFLPTELEFTVNGFLLAESGVDLDCNCPNGAPVTHQFTWKNVPPGEYRLGARFRAGKGQWVIATEVAIRVDPPTASASVVIVNPAEGTLFGAPTNVVIDVITRDPESHIPRVEFFADGHKLGESQVVFIREPDPGTPIQHRWTWTHPPLGRHTLTVLGTSAKGEKVAGWSPVTVTVGRALDLGLRIRLEPGGRASFVLPDGSMTGHGFDLYESTDLGVWRRVGEFQPGNVAAFFDLALDLSDGWPRFFRAQAKSQP